VFRFNRRHSRSRGLLFHRLMEQAVMGDAITHKELRKASRTRPAPAPPHRCAVATAQPGAWPGRPALAPIPELIA